MKTTSLYPIYEKYGARIIDFHGWALPLQFSGIIQEHLTVRHQAGLFDVSHMGEIIVEGPDASDFLDYALTNTITSLQPGSIRYSPLCLDHGGTLDDLLVYCLNPQKYLLVVNASNIETDFEHLLNIAKQFKVVVKNISAATAQLAIQGPEAENILNQLTDYPLKTLKYYQFAENVLIGGQKVLLSRTGYTGEAGFELYLDPAKAIPIWDLIISTGAPFGLAPIGLGARDTLRFEASLPLYGNELSLEISPLEAGLSRFIKFKKADFIGKQALLRQDSTGLARKLIGLEMLDRGVPRSGFPIIKNGQEIGQVTSGGFAPFLQSNLAMALIDSKTDLNDALLQIDIRGRICQTKVRPLPFYQRQKGE